MAVCWRCPSCNEISCEENVNLKGPVSCDHCSSTFVQQETLCPVCDASNPWTPRDSIHFWCRQCGTMQRYLSFS
jgi:predicted amidophosphoribosyltransferase